MAIGGDMAAHADVADNDVAAHADVAADVDLEGWRGGLINFPSNAFCAAMLSFLCLCDFSVAVAGGGA